MREAERRLAEWIRRDPALFADLREPVSDQGREFNELEMSRKVEGYLFTELGREIAAAKGMDMEALRKVSAWAGDRIEYVGWSAVRDGILRMPGTKEEE